MSKSREDFISLNLSSTQETQPGDQADKQEITSADSEMSQEKPRESAEERGQRLVANFKNLGAKLGAGLKRLSFRAIGGAAVGVEKVGSIAKSGAEIGRSALEKGSAAFVKAPELIDELPIFLADKASELGTKGVEAFGKAQDWADTKFDDLGQWVNPKYETLATGAVASAEYICKKGRGARDKYNSTVKGIKAWVRQITEDMAQRSIQRELKINEEIVRNAERIKADSLRRIEMLNGNARLTDKMHLIIDGRMGRFDNAVANF